jgi:hypothetical protein
MSCCNSFSGLLDQSSRSTKGQKRQGIHLGMAGREPATRPTR